VQWRIVAFEVASQLRNQGCDVDILVLLDALNPTVYFALPAWRRRASIKYHLGRLAALKGGYVTDFVRGRVDRFRKRLRRRPKPTNSDSFKPWKNTCLPVIRVGF